MRQPITIVDAFTDIAFKGNPAGVCVLAEARDEQWMQNVAMEMNQAETAFVWKRPDGAFPLRWFTPAAEVALCGHATLATAHVVWSTGRRRSSLMVCEVRPCEGAEVPSVMRATAAEGT